MRDLFDQEPDKHKAQGIPNRIARPCAHLVTRRVAGGKRQCTTCGEIIGGKRAGIDPQTGKPKWLPKTTKKKGEKSVG